MVMDVGTHTYTQMLIAHTEPEMHDISFYPTGSVTFNAPHLSTPLSLFLFTYSCYPALSGVAGNLCAAIGD